MVPATIETTRSEAGVTHATPLQIAMSQPPRNDNTRFPVIASRSEAIWGGVGAPTGRVARHSAGKLRVTLLAGVPGRLG